MLASSFWRSHALVLGLLSGCGPTIVLPGAEDSTGEDPPPVGSTSADTPGVSTGTAQPTSTGSGGSTGIADVDSGAQDSGPGGFVLFDDLGPQGWCDIFAQDCPAGQKCMPYSSDGSSSWNALGCFPIVEDPAGAHEPCSVVGNGVSGMDTCDLGLICWNVDPKTNEGTCYRMCTGDESNPVCEDSNEYCAISSDSAVVLCIPTCNPLAGDCPPGQGCYGVNETFSCIPDASGDMGAPGDSCEFINVCDPGTACMPAESVPGCMGALGCCSSFCDVNEPPTACLPGQACIPWYGDNSPGGYEDVGICSVPE